MPPKGYKMSPESRAKISASMRKRPPESAETRAKKGLAHRTHGHTAGPKASDTYVTWAAMKQRCLYPGSNARADYADRGITICERWMAFENFLADMGEKPDGLMLDRIDNDGNYEPGNCRWTTRSVQNRNQRRTTIRGIKHGMSKLTDDIVRALRAETGTYDEISARTGIHRSTVYSVRKRITWKHVD